MNERIKKLAEQSGFIGQSMNPIIGTSQETALKNFAELLIRECICQCDDLNSMKYIADHFGIQIEGLE
jgi:hypothetical protein